MKKVLRGLQEFKANYYQNHIELFEKLVHGQKPRVLFITCADSRINPNLLTQTEIGELFIIRNAGNIIPPFGAANSGEGATIEYAIHSLEIQHIIVCGHSHCGAMKGLLQLNDLREELPLMYGWLKHAEATRRLVKENYSHYQGKELLEITTAENVLTQIQNLKTYPVIQSKLCQGKLHIYGWIYYLETGEVFAYDPDTRSYIPPQTQVSHDEAEEDYTSHETIPSAPPPLACELPLYRPIHY
jgi:carbonic anhydrase